MEKLKLGIIGTGSVVREIYQHLYFNSEYSYQISIEGICDISKEGVDAFGDEHSIPVERRFSDYNKMIAELDLDAVAINTPDSLHHDPTIAAFEAGLDVLLPKPTADTIVDAKNIIEKAKELKRYIGVDFHKRHDPRMKEAQARYQNGDYGSFQSATIFMLDKLMVANPNNTPRFFASADFAEKNTPVSFLTVHMADAFMFITEHKPVQLKAIGYSQKLPTLTPIPVNGYDLVDTEILFDNGGVCHIITGWALPDTAHATTVQSARIIGPEGLLDLNLDMPGYHEILNDGIFERNPLFRNFESDGTVSGYGMSSPGRIIRDIIRFRNGTMSDEEYAKSLSPYTSGFYTTVVCEAAHESLAKGTKNDKGVTVGSIINIDDLI
jgi:predicted dehydrogenase